jgi:anti-sigma regulatory factor (Ser/Thr protein kinase)
MSILGVDVTPRSSQDFSYSKLFELLNIDRDDIPEYRAVKIINNEVSDGLLDSDEYYSRYNACTIIKIDYMKDKINSLLITNDLANCASFIVDNYFQNKFIVFLLPIEILISKIEANPISITIDIPIIYDIYNKHINNTKIQEQKEVYEDFIDQYNEFKPSNIFQKHTSLTKKEFYFLKYVSVPSIMYVSSDFNSSVELKQERLEVLNILSLLHKDKDITNEMNNIFDELVFENLKASFNSSKLHVDTQSLINNNEFEYKRLFNLLSAAKLTYDFDSEDSDYTLIDESDSVNTIMPNSDLSDVINQIYKQLLKDFVQDANYGLDKYISMEIRHEVFFTQLRVSVEKFNLLSEIGENNEFEINDYWLEKYSIVNELILNPIFEKINLFTKKFDDTIRSANNWFLVIEFTHQLETTGMFDFIATYQKLIKLKKITIDITEYEVFIDTLITYMWEITYESTEKIKRKLDESLKKELIGLMDNLIEDVHTLSNGVNMKLLIDVIELSKGSITAEIDTISSWLNKVEKNDDNYNISSIIKECMNMFTSILDNVNITINRAYDNSPIVDLSYLEARAIMTSLHISFTNIIKYGQKTNNKYEITIDLFTKPNSDMTIKIRNKIQHKDNIEEFKTKIKEKLSIKYEQLSKEESGGTGLHKIFNLFMNVSNKFNIDIDVDSNEFIVIIGVKNENNSN